MEDGKDDKAVMYMNFETGFGSLRIVKSLDGVIYISDTEMEEGYQ